MTARAACRSGRAALRRPCPSKDRVFHLKGGIVSYMDEGLRASRGKLRV